MDKLESLTDPFSQATVTRVFHAEGQALGQSGHQIRLDYKPENKPPARRAWSSAHWWVSGLAVPLVGGVLMLMGSAGGEAPAPATAIVTASMFETRPLPLPPLTAKDAAPTVVASQPVEPGPVDLVDLKELDLQIRRGDTLDQLFPSLVRQVPRAHTDALQRTASQDRIEAARQAAANKKKPFWKFW